MSLRTFSLALLLAGCGEAAAPPATAAEDDSRIDCAVGGSQVFERRCTIEREVNAEGALALTLRAPEGGFRRLLVTRDGRGVIAADGAEAATVRVISAGEIEVALAGDRYRLPATIK